MIEVVVTTGATTSHAKLQSNHRHQQTITQLFTVQMPFLSPNQQCQGTEGNHSYLHILHNYPHTRASVTKQYNLVPVNGWRCMTAGEVIVGLTESKQQVYGFGLLCYQLTTEDWNQLQDPMLVSSMGPAFRVEAYVA